MRTTVMCSICGAAVYRYKNTRNGPVCYDINCIIAFLNAYLDSMEKRRGKDEALNQVAFQQARELSAWISVYRYGTGDDKKSAEAIIRELL